jgi:hypothetical protein
MITTSYFSSRRKLISKKLFVQIQKDREDSHLSRINIKNYLNIGIYNLFELKNQYSTVYHVLTRAIGFVKMPSTFDMKTSCQYVKTIVHLDIRNLSGTSVLRSSQRTNVVPLTNIDGSF